LAAIIVSSLFKNTSENSEPADQSRLGIFQEKIGYSFRDRELLSAALCHASYANENGLPGSNERLEFLGDSVLGMITAHVLYETCPEASEGELTGHRMEFVCRDALAGWAESLEIEGVLMKGKSLKGSTPPSLLADAMEAVLGAVYLDGGYDAAVRVTRRYLFGSGKSLLSASGGELDAKSRLQMFLQAGGRQENGLPKYEILSVTGPSHSPTFRVMVRVKGQTWHGEGPNRKAAELEAALAALEWLEKNDVL
jgi:ribonuclease-3